MLDGQHLLYFFDGTFYYISSRLLCSKDITVSIASDETVFFGVTTSDRALLSTNWRRPKNGITSNATGQLTTKYVNVFLQVFLRSGLTLTCANVREGDDTREKHR